MTTTPNNLPRLQPFFGREAELRQIHEALDPAARTWGALIDGPGGMGKTSLAIQAAYDCPPGLFDRIIFTSIKDRELDPEGLRELSPRLIPGFIEMLNELARELKLPDFEKSPDTERPWLILEALRDRKVLLILDNLESLTKAERDQLFTFVKRLPGGCKAILTSRRRIGSGAEALILEKLSQDAALATLAELAGHNKLLARTNEAERIVLYTQTGGNPLLLRWTAGQLGRGSCRTFTDALDYLRSCPEGNDPLEFVFGDIAREFTDAETKVLCALTYFTQPATVEHIATVAGAEHGAQVGRAVPSAPPGATVSTGAPSTPLPDGAVRTPRPTSAFDLAAVETALRTLANRSLVVPDQEERAYTLVPMVADFLRQKRPETVAATGQHLEQRAFALIVENGFNKHDRFPILDAAWPTVAPAIPLFVAGPHPRLQAVCDALHDFLNFTGRWDEWLALNLQTEAKAVAIGDFSKGGMRAYESAIVYSLRGQSDTMMACARRVVAHWERANAGDREKAISISLLGRGHMLKKNYKAAITSYKKVLKLFGYPPMESRDVMIGLNDLAGAERRNGNLKEAERDYLECLRIAMELPDPEGVATCTGNLAGLALDKRDWDQALALAQQALSLAEKLQRLEMIAQSNCRIAGALLGLGRRTAARPYADQAVKIYIQLRSHELAAAQVTLKECQA